MVPGRIENPILRFEHRFGPIADRVVHIAVNAVGRFVEHMLGNLPPENIEIALVLRCELAIEVSFELVFYKFFVPYVVQETVFDCNMKIPEQISLRIDGMPFLPDLNKCLLDEIFGKLL